MTHTEITRINALLVKRGFSSEEIITKMSYITHKDITFIAKRAMSATFINRTIINPLIFRVPTQTLNANHWHVCGEAIPLNNDPSSYTRKWGWQMDRQIAGKQLVFPTCLC